MTPFFLPGPIDATELGASFAAIVDAVSRRRLTPADVAGLQHGELAALFALGQARLETQQPQQAVVLWSALVILTPFWAAAWRALAIGLHHQGAMRQGQAAYRIAQLVHDVQGHGVAQDLPAVLSSEPTAADTPSSPGGVQIPPLQTPLTPQAACAASIDEATRSFVGPNALWARRQGLSLTEITLTWAQAPAGAAGVATDTTTSPGVSSRIGAGEPRPKLLLQPLPRLLVTDRTAVQQEDRMRLAVALDVICSATRLIAPSPLILEHVVRAWLSLRGRHSAAETYQALLQQADSRQGSAQQRLTAELLAATQGDADAAAAKISQGPFRTAPKDLAAAARQVEAAADCVIDEAILWLSSQERIDYRRG